VSWCFQCGVASRPSKAVGVDEDGEPACSGHQVKEIGAGLNAAAASRTAVSAPIGFGKKAEAAQIKPAAPSPVQIKQESTMERTCKCGCGGTVPATNRFSYINGHRTRKVTPRKIRKNRDGSFTATINTPSLPVADRPIASSGSTESVFGVNHFTAGQLDRFWSLLSPVSKAEAVDRLLSYQPL
jgi:hypothetical protein